MSIVGSKKFFQAPERRYKLMRLPADLLMNLLFNPLVRDDEAELFKLEGIPDGCQIEGVCWDDGRECFVLRLFHESFDAVEPCDIIPEAVVSVRLERLRVVRNSPMGRQFI